MPPKVRGFHLPSGSLLRKTDGPKGNRAYVFINEPVHKCHINVPLRPVPGCRHLRMVVSFRKEERE